MKEINISDRVLILMLQIIIFISGMTHPEAIPEYMIAEVVLVACHRLIDIREAIEKKGV